MINQHILLWSGGLDSTAILLDLITKPADYPSVHIVGCGLKNANNYAEDKRAREQISQLLKIHEITNVTYTEAELDIKCTSGIQSMVWALISALSLSDAAKDITFVYGFIRYDDFWHYRSSFEAAVKNLCSCNKHIGKISFHYPLEWYTKKDIVYTYLNYRDVFDAISWGGDTESVKTKEKEELTDLIMMLQAAKDVGINQAIVSGA